MKLQNNNGYLDSHVDANKGAVRLVAEKNKNEVDLELSMAEAQNFAIRLLNAIQKEKEGHALHILPDGALTVLVDPHGE